MSKKVRVLIVDDSTFARYAILHQLQTDAEIEVIDFARDGSEALEKINLLKPDVVTMDIEMPHMDGLTALERTMSSCPIPIVMLSSQTGEGTEATIRALELGAVDFFLKPSPANPAGVNLRDGELSKKVKMAARAKVSKSYNPVISRQVHTNNRKHKVSNSPPAKEVVIIGSSTGGPKALCEVIPDLPADMTAAVLVVQHMPPGFTKSLANRLNSISQITVKEAESGDIIRQGQALLAPGGYHMVAEKGMSIGLNQNQHVCGVRPSVDVTMESASRVFRASSLGVVLTGMGSDGTTGTSFIKAAGGQVIAEDESTCTVWGMPKSVIEAGNADRVLPLHLIASEIVIMLNINTKVTG
ncbi:chemotaxis response regulator protein-glutamate methylesterase [Chloroflexota bacterium]